MKENDRERKSMNVIAVVIDLKNKICDMFNSIKLYDKKE